MIVRRLAEDPRTTQKDFSGLEKAGILMTEETTCNVLHCYFNFSYSTSTVRSNYVYKFKYVLMESSGVCSYNGNGGVIH